MKKIIRAKAMGFCMGVERAVAIVQKIADEKEDNAVTLGPIIHNQQIVDKFASLGIPAVESIEEVKEGRAVIRAHGVPLSERKKLEDKGVEIIDGTCPKVIASHKIVQKYSSLGYHIIIVGDKNHGEIKGLAGYADDFDIIGNADEASLINPPDKSMVISQTTIKESEFESVCRVLKEKNRNVIVHNSICSATNDRQNAVKKLAGEVDALLVIGGKNSANTKRLYLTVKEMNVPCWHISTVEEIPPEISSYDTIGLTAGASTPDWIVDEVENSLLHL
ncbi:4-hydroxy-3-methylbut-2-enyl diphosphate reductase [Spirochaeta isovalerica]|uniref:4-hydroxy-3-methylbut-2-enyl diphosphate reductase n=1 Tax=Spirochaeta isovalerica TaxID=150 RepID=A0A841RHK1_9SPIO|nr:4-hydroxy-3-methylbut-2-enyl diphosphate reductase [Spirochaeta isovalerica]MBB6482490.1 4-hydroxy-3-methylbut-2-enyl diphosphate reductase [Spirochaeta isovalerica]